MKNYIYVKSHLWFFLLVAVVIVLILINLAAADQKELFKYERGLYSIRTKNISPSVLLEKISEISNVKIYLFDKAGKKNIDCDFQNKRLEEILETIMKGKSFAILYNAADGSNETFVESQTVLQKKYELAVDDEMAMSGASASSEGLTDGYVDIDVSINNSQNVSESKSQKNVLDDNSNRKKNKYTIEGSEVKKFILSDSRNGGGDAVNVIAGYPPEATTGGVDGSSGLKVISNSQTTSNEAKGREAVLRNKIAALEERIQSGQSDDDYEFWSKNKGEKYVTHDRETLEYYQDELSKIY